MFDSYTEPTLSNLTMNHENTIYYNHLNKIVFGVNENRDKAKQGLVTLELVFTGKIAETQNLIC